MLRLRVLIVILVGLIASSWATPMQAQDDQAAETDHPVIGSWLVEVTVEGASPLLLPNLASFTADGVVVVSAPALLPELPGGPAQNLFSSGHGAWTASGDNAADVRFVFLVVDEQGRPSSINVIDGRLEVDDSENVYSGEYTLTIVSAQGQPQPPATGTWRATRITVGAEMMATPTGMDVEATPAVTEPDDTPVTELVDVEDGTVVAATPVP